MPFSSRLPLPSVQARLAGFTTGFKAVGYSIKEAKVAGFAADELRTAGYSCEDVKIIGFSAVQVGSFTLPPSPPFPLLLTPFSRASFGFSAAQAKAAGYNAKEAKAAGWTWEQLAEAGYALRPAERMRGMMDNLLGKVTTVLVLLTPSIAFSPLPPPSHAFRRLPSAAQTDLSDAGLAKMFARLDADASGRIDAEEMRAAIAKVYGEKVEPGVVRVLGSPTQGA